ncbi:MAG: hypothetical protein RTU63_09530 [Candidatus Thorarchaeota archaeon]
MKLKVLSLIFALILIYSSTPISVEAQTHSLEWGVDVDEEFTYVMQRAYFADPSYRLLIGGSFPFISSMTVGEKTTLRITSLDEIPTLINESSQIPKSSCNLERANDSLLLDSGLTLFVTPKGDWEFVNQISNLTGLTLVDTAEEWGTSGTSSQLAPDGSVITTTMDLRYEKENGTLNYMRLRLSTLSTDLIDVIIVNWHPGIPTVVSGELQLPTILIISIGAVVGLIVAIIVYQGYRSKKPVVQKLGE